MTSPNPRVFGVQLLRIPLKSMGTVGISPLFLKHWKFPLLDFPHYFIWLIFHQNRSKSYNFNAHLSHFLTIFCENIPKYHYKCTKYICLFNIISNMHVDYILRYILFYITHFLKYTPYKPTVFINVFKLCCIHSNTTKMDIEHYIK